MKVLHPKIWVITSKNEGFGFPWHVINSWNTPFRFCLRWLAKLKFIFPKWSLKIHDESHGIVSVKNIINQTDPSKLLVTKKKGVSLGNTPPQHETKHWLNPKSKSRRCSLHFILPPLRFTAPYNSWVFPPQDKMQRPWLHLLMPRPHLRNNQAHWHHVHCLHSSWFLAWHPVLLIHYWWKKSGDHHLKCAKPCI